VIRLRTLGTLDLTADVPDESLGRLIHQPKRLALLAYLTVNSNGPVRRDTLLGLFWPELSQERARHALSQALYVVRQSLGDGLVEASGQEVVGIDRTRIWCDAAEFTEALAQGERAQALELYRGDLLDGFFLSDASEFERWLEVERANLRQGAVDAAKALAISEEDAGNLPGAARWARRLVQLTPYDEPSAVYLIELLAGSGDRSGAHHEFKQFSERLRADLDIEPSAELEQALANLEQQAVPGRVTIPAVQDSGASRQSEVAPLLQPSPESEPRDGPRSQRRWLRPFGIAVVSLAAIIPFTNPLQFVTSIFSSEQGLPRVLVTVLANQTGDSATAPLALLASDWLSSEIARTGLVSVIPPVYALQLLREVEGEGDGEIDQDEEMPTLARILTVAQRADVELVLGGRISGTVDSTYLDIFGLDPVTGEYVFVLEPVPVSVAAPQEALEQLRGATIVALAEQLDDKLRGWSAVASHPPSYQSFRRYTAALDVFDEAANPKEFEQAAALLLEAWRADTTFTAPLIWGMYAFLNANDIDRADSLAHALEPGVESLAEWDRRMLRHLLAYLHGDLRGEYRTAAAVVELAPNSEWRLKLARHLTGAPVDEARDAFLAEEQLTDELHPGQGYRTLAAKIRAAALGGSEDDLSLYLGEARTLGTRAHYVYLKLLYWGPFDLSADSRAHQTILDSAWAWYGERPDQTTCPLLNIRYHMLYRSGRWQEADRALDQATEADCLDWPEYGVYHAVIAARTGDAARAMAIIDSFPWEQSNDHYFHVAVSDEDFWRARVEAILGDPATAVAHLRAANSYGVPYEAVFHGDARVDFDEIWDYGPLQRLVVGRECEA